ncbi:MAG: pilus assembly protein [Selenomonadaceae bacterium]|nr:pilus assembly protein [Selenomonadaceae bacterium]
MKKQRGQSAVEFALMAPLVMFMVLTAIYGGAMFIQFMNYSNEARRIARDIAVTDATKRKDLVTKYETAYTETNTRVGMYQMTLKTQFFKTVDGNVTDTTSDDTAAEEVQVIFDFNLSGRKFPFDFPPEHFAASYHMKLE